jgi:hypothetical protein
MSERTIHIFAEESVVVFKANGDLTQNDVIVAALDGDAFSWENPGDVKLTFGSPDTFISFNDADGYLTDDPFSGNGSSVIDQQLTQEVTIGTTTYSPSDETLRWKNAVNVENEYEVTLYDDSGTAYRMVGVSITEAHVTTVVGVSFDGPAPAPNTTLTYIQGVSSYSQTGQSVVISDDAICFLAGTLIDTPSGPRRIEDLAIGDTVTTLDSGPQTIRWIGRNTVSGLGVLAPIRIAAGALGNDRDLLVSPNHRILLRSDEAAMCFGHCEMLASAKSLVEGMAIRIQPMRRATYLHLLLDRHEMVFAEGIASETLLAGAITYTILGPDVVADLHASVPWIANATQQMNRPEMTNKEARLLAGCHSYTGVARGEQASISGAPGGYSGTTPYNDYHRDA